MIDFSAFDSELSMIQQMSLYGLLKYGEKLFSSIMRYKEKERSKAYLLTEFDDDCSYCDECRLEKVDLAIFKKIVEPSVVDDRSARKYFKFDFDALNRKDCTYEKYVNKSLCSYFFQNIDKNDRFCKEVVAFHISKDPEYKGNTEEDVQKWVELHNSQEFKNNIAQDVFSISHYMEGIRYMIDDYVKNRIKTEKPTVSFLGFSGIDRFF